MTASGSRARIRGLDGPRGFACLCVLVVHVAGRYSPTMTEHAYLGLLGQALIFFFALSGFLLYLPYARAFLYSPALPDSSTALPDVRSYAVHRVLRVFPAYLVIFVFSNVVLQAVFVENAAIVDEPFTDRGTGLMTDPLALLTNLTLLHSFFPQYLQTGINPSWSLSLELCFYAALPALAALAWRGLTRLGPVWSALVPVISLVVVGLVGKIVTAHAMGRSDVTDPLLREWGPNGIAVLSRSCFSLADNFAYGMIAAVIYVAMERGLIRGVIARRMRWWTALLGAPALVLTLAAVAAGSQFQTTFMAMSSGLFILFVVAPFARGDTSRFAEILDLRPMHYVGTISLSVYLWHYPVLIVFGRWGLMIDDTWPGLMTNVLLVAAASIGLGAITYRFVEKPALDRAKTIGRSLTPAPAVR